MIPLQQLEAAFLNRLTLHFGAELAVLSYPARTEGYKLLHPAGAVLIAYLGSDYSDPLDLGGLMQQNRTLRWGFVLQTRNRFTHAESLPWLDRLRGQLTGFIPQPGCSRCRLTREQFLSEDDGLWTWEIAVSFELPQVEDADTEDLMEAPYTLLAEAAQGAPLQQITVTDGVAQIDIESDDGAITVLETPREAPLCGSE